jgi:hypothetical protein
MKAGDNAGFFVGGTSLALLAVTASESHSPQSRASVASAQPSQ